MGWLKGSTDITNFRADLYALLSGTMAAGSRGSGQAGNGNTLSASDKWTALDGTNFVIRSQATESPFTGEYTMWRGIPRFASRSTSTVISTIGRPTFSGVYSGVTVRAYFAAFVSVNNAAPGSLASTQVSWTLVNADTGATVTSGTATGWTGSTDTKLLTQGISLTLTLNPSDQFVGGANAIMWLRAYTTTLTDGIDYFPEAAQIASGLVLANSSGGANAYTSGVDYDLAQQGHTFPQVSTTIGYSSAATEWGGTGAGCGIHWKTGGSPVAVGTTYYIPASYLVYAGYYQVPNVVSIGGNFALTGAPMNFWDPTTQVGRHVLSTASPKTTLNTTLSYGQLFTGAAQVGTTFINFWISATTSKIVMVFRGDTGQSGRLIILTLQRTTPLVTTDKWPWIFIPDGGAAASNGGAHLISTKYVYEQPYYGSPSTSLGVISLPMFFGPQPAAGVYRLRMAGITDSGAANSLGNTMPQNNPNNWDLRYWLYSIYHTASHGGGGITGVFDATKAMGLRGKMRGIFGIANDNFANLDELVDISATYLLVIPTTNWQSSQGQAYTAVAVQEE